ncbi:MAG TPA: NBR1-Ig-like domain-containing protein [Casimicrobiaceae bacterium]|nr:NBR1-Ig-like domain-containing protein [Casimicrobiaceae bacterium]
MAYRAHAAAVGIIGLALLVATAPTARAQLVHSAAFVSQSVPSFIPIGAVTSVSVTMQNTGTATWYQAQGDVFLATQEPQDNYYWCIQDNVYGSHSGNRVLLPYDVAPGAQVTFSFQVNPLGCRFAAPAPFRFRMLSQIYGTFGDETPDPHVVVNSAAKYLAQQVPAIVPAAATFQVTETFENTTTVTWSPTDGYTLASAGPAGNAVWATSSVPLPSAVPPAQSVTFSFFVVAPTALGSYNMQWQMSSPQGAPFGDISPATSVTVVAAGPPNYGGLWWARPAGVESGWGMNIAHQDDTLFVTWFTYDANGNGWWLSMTAPLISTGVYSGTLQEATGPPFNAVPFAPNLVRQTSVGTGQLTFTDVNNATFNYTVNGITQTKTITRQVFGQLPTCTFNLLTDLSAAYNYQDLWWAAPAGSEAGWGLNVTQQGDVIFITWFTYDLDGTSMWLFATTPKTGPGTYAGTLYRTTGPPFDAVPFSPAKVVATQVGTAALSFSDGQTGSFTYTVNGVTQTKSITRQIFVPPGTVCQ